MMKWKEEYLLKLDANLKAGSLPGSWLSSSPSSPSPSLPGSAPERWPLGNRFVDNGDFYHESLSGSEQEKAIENTFWNDVDDHDRDKDDDDNHQ